MIALISLVLFLYPVLRLVVPLPVSKKGKCAAGLFILLVSLKHFFLQWSGSLSSPELPRLVILFAGWLYVALVFLFILLLLRDIVLLLLLGFAYRHKSVRLAITNPVASVLLAACAFLCASWGVWQAIRLPDIHAMSVRFDALPKELDGLVVVQITDLHTSRLNPEENVRMLVESVNRTNPDFIMLTGDLVDGSVAHRENDVAPLKDLKAKYGVYGVVGNHEYYSGYRPWYRHFAALGITMLDNSHVVRHINGKPVVIAGVTDPVATRFGTPAPDAALAFQGAPTDAFRILLAHQPRGSAQYARQGAHLQLSGHTHGGQIIGLDRIVALFNEGYLLGWYAVDGTSLYVSSGAHQWNGFPVRFGVNAEVARITLRTP
ncbi:MAG: metallophosphoesterase [Burkholderiaceae bacterium]|jgi:predicted MPP superfamily phosphohydrolase|nr:metallophosphoesterase [Burkholderiaceae bacterium]